MNGKSTLIALLDGGRPDAAASQAWRSLLRATLAPLVVTLILLTAWGLCMPIAGAVVAPAEVRVEFDRRVVQHQEGGIVREILVRNGQLVHAGDPLAVIGNVRSDADLSLLKAQRCAEVTRLSRATVEARLAPRLDMTAGPGCEPHAAQESARQLGLFVARRRALDDQVGALEHQIEDARQQVAALEIQVGATEKSARYAAEELAMNEQLVQQGFVQRTRLLALQRDASDYVSRLGEQKGASAAAREHIGQLQSRIADARNQYQAQAASEVNDATARLREFDERLRTAQDTTDRQILRTPVDGEVMNLRVAAPGQVLGPRDPVADIVPRKDKLVVEARIRPQDIDSVHAGGAADVRIDAFDTRRTPLLHGSVVFVSPDRVTNPDGREAWFTATVEVALDARADTDRLRLRPGMPAEVFVTTSARTLFQYLVKPFSRFSQRAMRES